jgi:Uma2 family endonuclease
MADPAQDIPRMSAADYLACEKRGTGKHEFVNGLVYAMSGASRQHDLISESAFATLIGGVLAPFQVYSSDVKVHIRAVSAECFCYPDISVTSECVLESVQVAVPPAAFCRQVRF